MKFNKNLAAIHGYLCGDGYVIKNPQHQQHKYYHIGLRNTDSTLLTDFQKRFKEVFGLKPHIVDGRCRIQNKDIYNILTKDYSYYSYEWKLPQLSKENLRYWLMAFFDCEGWVENQPAKSRIIGLECCNRKGIFSIQKELNRFGIDSKVSKKKGRTIWRLTICGLNNLKRYNAQIGFLHPDKAKKLKEALSSYKNYNWTIPKTRTQLFYFIRTQGREQKFRNEILFIFNLYF